MTEEWKDIPGLEGRYQASSEGRIRSLPRMTTLLTGPKAGSLSRVRGCVRKAHLSRKYLQLNISRAGKKEVHRLVCLAFHGLPPFPEAQAAHRDGDRMNNKAGNLYWASRSQNAADAKAHGRMAGRTRTLSPDRVREIRAISGSAPLGTIAAQFGVSRDTVANILNNRSWRNV